MQNDYPIDVLAKLRSRPDLGSSFVWMCLICFLNACTLIKPVTAPVNSSSIVLHQQHLASLDKIQHFLLKSKLGVVTSPNGFSGSLIWRHGLTGDQLEIFSPFGSKVADIVKTADEVVLTDQNGKTIRATDVETLTETHLGWRLPLAGLNDWLIGRPAKSPVEAASWDEQGRLLTLKQNGWEIKYADYSETDGYYLPGKIIVKNPNVGLKLLVEQWSDL